MNKNNILSLINEFPNITQRKLAEKLNLSLGKINVEIKKLENNGILTRNNGYYLTEK